MFLQSLLFFLVVSIAFAFICLAGMLGLSCIFLLSYVRLKRKQKSLLAGRFFSLDLLQQVNYFLLFAFFVLVSFGTFSGILVVSFFQAPFVLAKIRVLLPLVLCLLAAFAVYDHYRRGIRGKVLSYWSIIIFSVASVVLFYEVYFFNVFEFQKS